jgi:hypothetical protein
MHYIIHVVFMLLVLFCMLAGTIAILGMQGLI